MPKKKPAPKKKTGKKKRGSKAKKEAFRAALALLREDVNKIADILLKTIAALDNVNGLALDLRDTTLHEIANRTQA